jgi:hypothetical protein
MKLDKDELKKDIENIIADGVMECEEVDITAKKVMGRINDLILLNKRLQKYKDEHQAMLKDPKKHGEYLAGL